MVIVFSDWEEEQFLSTLKEECIFGCVDNRQPLTVRLRRL